MRQFIDIGSGYPTAGPVHEIAAEEAPDPRVLYVDYDPVVAGFMGELPHCLRSGSSPATSASRGASSTTR